MVNKSDILKMFWEKSALAFGIMFLLVWAVKPSTFTVECLGCVSVPATQVGGVTGTLGMLPSTTPNVASEAPEGKPEEQVPDKPEGSDTKKEVASADSKTVAAIPINKTCVGVIITPRPPPQLTPIPEAVRNDPKLYVAALQQRIQVMVDMQKDYQSRVESVIRKYNINCK